MGNIQEVKGLYYWETRVSSDAYLTASIVVWVAVYAVLLGGLI